MKKFNHETWSLQIPKDWSIEESEECMSFYSPDENRSLHISDYFKDDAQVTLEDVLEMSEWTEYKPTNLEYFHGIQNSEIIEDELILSWWLYIENQLIFVEYMCLASVEQTSRQEAVAFIDSLRSVHHS